MKYYQVVAIYNVLHSVCRSCNECLPAPWGPDKAPHDINHHHEASLEEPFSFLHRGNMVPIYTAGNIARSTDTKFL